MSNHKDLTGSDLHRMIGSDTGGANTVFIADGKGSGSWKPYPIEDLTSAEFLYLQDTKTRSYRPRNDSQFSPLHFSRQVVKFGDALEQVNDHVIKVRKSGTLCLSLHLNFYLGIDYTSSLDGSTEVAFLPAGVVLNEAYSSCQAVFFEEFVDGGHKPLEALFVQNVSAGAQFSLGLTGWGTYSTKPEKGYGGLPTVPACSLTAIFTN